ncbi:unnamed protein product [Schistosoma turkestanicum]|nr:unnamed protein product [Schistosoma turkestanicum]
MSYKNYSSNTSESDLNELSFSLCDSNDEQEIHYEELGELKNAMIIGSDRNFKNLHLLNGTQTIVASTSESLVTTTFMNTTTTTTTTSSRSMVSSSLSPEGKLTMNKDGTERKGLTTTKHDRRMAKQMTERKRRDRINALLDNLRTLILKLLHKNPRHHRKLEKADILELVVSFLKKELNQNRLKTTLFESQQQQQQLQNNCRLMYPFQNSNYPTKIESSSSAVPLVYPNNNHHHHQNYYYPNRLLTSIPQSSSHQSINNYYFDKNNDHHNNNHSSKINNYPLYNYTQQNITSTDSTIPYQSSYTQQQQQHQHHSLPTTNYSQLINYQPSIMFTSTDDLNKENQYITGNEHLQTDPNVLIKKDTSYYPTCNCDENMPEQDVERQPLNPLNNNNNNNDNNLIGQHSYYQSNPTVISRSYLQQQHHHIQSTPHSKMYPDLLNSHLNYKSSIMKDENYSKSNLNNHYTNGNQSFGSLNHGKNNSDDSKNNNNNSSVLTMNNERICLTESTSFERLWRPYV